MAKVIVVVSLERCAEVKRNFYSQPPSETGSSLPSSQTSLSLSSQSCCSLSLHYLITFNPLMAKRKVTDTIRGSSDEASANPTQPSGPTDPTSPLSPLPTPDPEEAAMDLGDDDLRLLCVIKGESESFPIDVKGSLWRNPKFMVVT